MDNEIEELFEQQMVKVERKKKHHNNTTAQEVHRENRLTISDFLEKHLAIISFVSAIFVPYIFGMLLILVLFYFYLDISVIDFFHAYSGFSQLVFWIVGTYLIITLGDIWLISKKLLG